MWKYTTWWRRERDKVRRRDSGLGAGYVPRRTSDYDAGGANAFLDVGDWGLGIGDGGLENAVIWAHRWGELGLGDGGDVMMGSGSVNSRVGEGGL